MGVKKATYRCREEALNGIDANIMASRRMPLFTLTVRTEDAGPEYALIGPFGTLLPEVARLVLTEVLHSIEAEIAEAVRTRIETRGRPSR